MIIFTVTQFNGYMDTAYPTENCYPSLVDAQKGIIKREKSIKGGGVGKLEAIDEETHKMIRSKYKKVYYIITENKLLGEIS